MRLLVNLALSLAVLALCVWLIWPAPDAQLKLQHALAALSWREFWPYLVGYVGFLAATHFFRAWRWNNLLAPIKAKLPPGELLGISSIGFMAILALPARLGEFARPALLRARTNASGSAVLGTVAVERIVDGLLVSLMVFFCLYERRGPGAPSWMMPVAFGTLGIFLAATLFLVFALRRPRQTVDFCLKLSLLPRLAPGLARKIEAFLHKAISGFRVLGDGKNLAAFVVWSVLYWAANGLGTWVLAVGMGLHLSIVGAFATMGMVAVGIMLPNTPGLVGQFHAFTILGLALYMPREVAESDGLLYASVLHAVQCVWYVAWGALSMVLLRVHWRQIVGQKVAEDVVEA